MSRSFTLTPEARQNASDIWDYFAAQAGQRQADRVLARIYDDCERLATTPGLGHFRADSHDPDLKFFLVYSYLIVFRWQTRPLQVVAVIHGARDLPKILKRRAAGQ